MPINKEDNNNVTTSFLISSQLPFPLSGESYNPVYLEQPQKEFEFKLLVFQTKNKNIDFENSVVDEFKDEDTDLPIVETGTIGLTFPKDDEIISEEDEIEIVSEDDEVIDDVPEENDKDIPDDGHEIIPENDVEVISNDTVIVNDKVDYSKIFGFVVLLSVMIVGFAIFKRFRESGFKNILKQKPLQQHQSVKKKFITQFDDKLHVDIWILNDNV